MWHHVDDRFGHLSTSRVRLREVDRRLCGLGVVLARWKRHRRRLRGIAARRVGGRGAVCHVGPRRGIVGSSGRGQRRGGAVVLVCTLSSLLALLTLLALLRASRARRRIGAIIRRATSVRRVAGVGGCEIRTIVAAR